MSLAEALLHTGLPCAGATVGVWLGYWSWGLTQRRQQRREAKRLVARSLGGSVVAETKPHRRTIRRK